MSVIETKNLTKYYKDQCVLDSINLTFQENTIYGLLGRNGAGKTTLLNMISNRVFPTGGTVLIDGQEARENDDAQQKIFFMTEQNLYPERMTVKECFHWTAACYPGFDLEYAKSLCEKFGLSLKKRIHSLSTGYQSITKIITALSTQAPILLLDEPVLGLDANHRDLFYKDLLQNYIGHPKTIVLSTHIIEEIAELLEHVVIVKDRKVIVDDSVGHLLEQAYEVSGPAEAVRTFSSGKHVIHKQDLASFSSVSILGTCKADEKKQAQAMGLELGKIELQKLFIHLTNGEERNL